MSRIGSFSLVLAIVLLSALTAVAQSDPCIEPEPQLGEHLFALGWAMGWAEIYSLERVPASTFIPNFEKTRAAAEAYGYPPEVLAEMDAILSRVRGGAAPRDVYERISTLRIRMQHMSADWYACGRTGERHPPPPPPPGCDQPLSCGFCLGSCLRSKWLSMGGEGGVLGCPAMSEADAARSPQGTTGRYAEFRGGDGGYIVWHGSGPRRGNCYEVHGCFYKLYKSYGGTTSWLGFPVSDGYNAQGGARQDFEGGYLTWGATTRQCQSHGGSGPVTPPPPGCDQPLSCGFCLGSCLRSKWLSMGGEGGVLGCPTMNEADAARSPKGTTGRYAEFRGGDGGYIVWHGSGPKQGTCFEVHGCFFKLYKSYGGTASWLGFPVSDGFDVPGGARQNFEGGYLTWDASTRKCDSHRGDDVRASLDGLRWQIPCTNSGPEYWCECSDPAPVSTELGGPQGTTYDVTLRFRGVVELKTYSGGSNDGAFWQVGGSPEGDTYNVYKLEISSPPQVYYLNRGTSGLQFCQAIDYTKKVLMTVGARVTLVAQAIDGRQIRNRDSSGNPLSAAGMGAYNGQFIQMDVVDVATTR